MSKGFTLVELLITIGIVAVVTALAVPAVSQMRGRAHTARCLSNLRQIGVGLNSYLADHDQQMPVMEAGRADKSQDVPVVDTVLAEYLDDPAVFACPADREYAARTGTSYYWNVALNGQRTVNLNFLDLVEASSRIPVLSDKEGWHRSGSGKVHFLYADGHAGRELELIAGP